MLCWGRQHLTVRVDHAYISDTAVSRLQAFTRCAQQEPDNGEAWNNLAAIHLQLRRPAEAFNALSEAVKVKRDSWQTWGNYAQAAAQTGHWLQAARGVLQVSSAGGCLPRGAISRWLPPEGCCGSAQQAAACRGVQSHCPVPCVGLGFAVVRVHGMGDRCTRPSTGGRLRAACQVRLVRAWVPGV